ncbi:MAG: hypothetical protein K2X27_20310 [Candidatus Obscuribacterales bacterium]|nr:hypothetical protein [Candidatus Obscuribacterales bacterium]
MAKKYISKSAPAAVSCLARQSLWLCLAFSLSLSPLSTLPLMAQVATPGARTDSTTTILPTDVVPLADREGNKTPIGELLQLKIMQRLPAQLYFSSSIEVTGRDETNPFQFPTKRALMAQLPRPAIWRNLNAVNQASLYDILGQVARNNLVFRALPNISGGWAFTPHTRLFTNYFMIRDQLTHNMRLNTVIHSYSIGLQHDKPVGSKGSLQFEFQGRELWQLHQKPVFDFLPAVTLSYILTPRTVLFVNSLVQLRGLGPFVTPNREIDPFYTWGGLYQKNGWTFSASTTFVQNFRQPFHHAATIPKNNYVFISDFEVARRVMKQYPGLQAFVRAEPIWNFHAHNTPSLSGMDFRLFFGMRFAMAKPALTATLQQIREQLKQDSEPEPNAPGKPSAQMIQENEITMNPQPIHGFLERNTLAETCMNPDGDTAVIAQDESEATKESAKEAQSEPIATVRQLDDRIAESNIAEASPENTDKQSLLENIAEESKAASPEQQLAQNNSNAILDLSKTNLDWTEFETAENADINLNDRNSLHQVLAQAEAHSNKEALNLRSEEIRKLAEKNEEDYRLSFAPVPLPVPATAAQARVIPQAPKQVQKIASGTSSKLIPSVQKPEAKLLKPLAATNSLATRSLPSVAPSSLTLSAKTPSLPSSQAGKNKDIALVPELKTPILNTDISIPQPLSRQDQKLQSLSSAVSPSTIKNESKTDKLFATPVPIQSAIAKSAPNTVPAPVSGKLQSPEQALPSPTAIPLTAKTTATESPVEQKASEKRPTRVIANKDGSIPLSEAKLDNLAAAETASSTDKTQVAATPTAKLPVLSRVPQNSPVSANPLTMASASSGVSTSPKVIVPVAAEPVAAKPVAAKPVAAKPVIAEPVAKVEKASVPVAAVPLTSHRKSDNSISDPLKVREAVAQDKATGKPLVANLPAKTTFNQVAPAILPNPKADTASKTKQASAAPVLQMANSEEISIAVSDLSDNEIASPKIAMALYDNWQSPVLDDPLIEDAQSAGKKLSSLDLPTDKLNKQKPSKQNERNRTDMKLIPPFPSAKQSSKDSPLNDLQIPVLPVH